MTVLCPILLLMPQNPVFLKFISAGSSFSKVSWLRSAIEYANTRFQDMGTFYYYISTKCSCLHFVGRAYSASGNETNHTALFQAFQVLCRFCHAAAFIMLSDEFLIDRMNNRVSDG